MAARKVVLVTGGNNGIGYEAVKAFLQSQKPYHVLLGSRSVEKGKLAVETLHKEVPESKNTVEVLQVDLESDESIEKAFEKVKKSPGQLDALVNNAGTQICSCPLTLRELTTHRGQFRPRIPLRQNLSARLLQQSLRR